MDRRSSVLFAVKLRMMSRVYKRVFQRLAGNVVPGNVLLLTAFFFSCSQTFGFQATWQKNFQAHRRTIKVVSTSLSGFGIPFNIDDENGQFIEVQLYVSRDEGQNWSFHSRQPVAATEFPFKADGEGEYWFAIKTLDRNRRLLPDGDAIAELKVIVDAQKPQLEFQIESDPAGRVICRWQARDRALDVESFRIDYRPAEGQFNGNAIDDSWSTVPVKLPGVARNGAWSDQVAWWPDTSAKLYEVRMSIADDAGNTVQASRQVSVAGAAWRRSSSSSTMGNRFYQPPPTRRPAPAEARRETASTQSPTASKANWKKTLHAIETDSRSTYRAESNEGNFGSGQRSNHANRAPTRRASRAQQLKPQVDPRWRTNTPPAAKTAPPKLAAKPAKPANGEFIAPPLPVDWSPNDQSDVEQVIAATPLGSAPQLTGEQDSIPWESEIISRQRDKVDISSTALRPNQNVLPWQKQLPPRSTDNIASNPGTTVRSGAKIIGQSTTSWPSNQWKGPTDPIRQPNSELAPDANRELAPEPLVLPEQPIDRLPFLKHQPARFTKAGFAGPAESQFQSEPQLQTRSQPPPAQTKPTFETAGRDGGDMPDSANTQIIGTKRFELNYDVNAIDPSGVGQVDLWVTRNRGRTWKLWGYDPDHASPFPVEVTEEGLYGFRIAIRSKDGIAGRGPSSGDQPDMWVLIDVTSPLVKITSVPYGRQSEAGNLVINYSVSDTNLTLRPIELAWSTNPDGPWTTIEKDLRNEGRFVWKPGQNVPERVFLRARANDRAGNVGLHHLSQTIDMSGLVPRGTIFGVVPVGK